MNKKDCLTFPTVGLIYIGPFLKRNCFFAPITSLCEDKIERYDINPIIIFTMYVYHHTSLSARENHYVTIEC